MTAPISFYLRQIADHLEKYVGDPNIHLLDWPGTPAVVLIVAGPAATDPVEALANLRAGRHTDGTVQWDTQALLDLATAKAQEQRALANPALGDDPDLWEGASRIGLNEDLTLWRGRKWADYVTQIHPELGPGIA